MNLHWGPLRVEYRHGKRAVQRVRPELECVLVASSQRTTPFVCNYAPGQSRTPKEHWHHKQSPERAAQAVEGLSMDVRVVRDRAAYRIRPRHSGCMENVRGPEQRTSRYLHASRGASRGGDIGREREYGCRLPLRGGDGQERISVNDDVLRGAAVDRNARLARRRGPVWDADIVSVRRAGVDRDGQHVRERVLRVDCDVHRVAARERRLHIERPEVHLHERRAVRCRHERVADELRPALRVVHGAAWVVRLEAEDVAVGAVGEERIRVEMLRRDLVQLLQVLSRQVSPVLLDENNKPGEPTYLALCQPSRIDMV